MSKMLDCYGISQGLDEIGKLKAELVVLIGEKKIDEGKIIQSKIEEKLKYIKERLPIDWDDYTLIAGTNIATGSLLSDVKIWGKELCFHTRDKIIRMDESFKGEIKTSSGVMELGDLAVCGDRLVLLDTKNKCIRIINPGKDPQTIDCKDVGSGGDLFVVDVAEDGRIFVKRENGIIEEYQAGVNEPRLIREVAEKMYGGRIKYLPGNRLLVLDNWCPGVIDLGDENPEKNFQKLEDVGADIITVAVGEDKIYFGVGSGMVEIRDPKTLEKISEFNLNDYSVSDVVIDDIIIARDGSVVVSYFGIFSEYEAVIFGEPDYETKISEDCQVDIFDGKGKMLKKLWRATNSHSLALEMGSNDSIIAASDVGEVKKFGKGEKDRDWKKVPLPVWPGDEKRIRW